MERMEKISLRASAGTGKTYSLVDRYCELLGVEHQDGGAPRQLRNSGGRPEALQPEEIIAVTFTRKAAAELRERLRSRLYEAGKPELAQRIDGACIGTVHSVCLRLLQEYALEAGLSPSATELTEEESDRLILQAVTLAESESMGSGGISGRELAELFSRFGLDRCQYGEDAVAPEDIWIHTCRDLISLARANGLDDRLLECGERSWQEMLALLETFGPERDDLEACRETLEEVCRLQGRLNLYRRTGRGKDASGQKKYSDAVLKHAKAASIAYFDKNWQTWIRFLRTEDLPLLEEHPENAGRPGTAQEMREAVRPLYCLKEFRRDLQRLICGMFSFASEAMEKFTRLKQQAGVIDFADMERNACKALESEAVRQRMRGRFRALFVDEFQDSNPMQLHIFNLLEKIMEEGGEACRIICVGDSKQSIYGFRGAAPELTEAVTASEGWTDDKPLSTCYRSHPEVVGFVNEFFSGLGTKSALCLLRGEKDGKLCIEASGKQKEAAAEQEGYYAERPGEWNAPLRFWPLEGKNEELRNDDLALRIHGLLAEKPRIPLKDRKGLHELRPGHIAVLCRTGAHGEALAAALEKRGIRACMARGGLLEQPHIRFCLAAFRAACSDDDTLALAEMASFLGLDWAALALEKKLDPVARKLEPVRARRRTLSPAEMLDAVLEAENVFRLLAGSEHAFEALADMEALRTLASEYENAMQSSREAATPIGWLDWLEAEKPKRAAGGRDAVKIWTYHGSKGLESPVIILHDLHKEPKQGSLWGLHVSGERQAGNLLAGRTMRWMPDVLGKVSPELCESFCSHIEKEQQKADDERRAEDLRLLYVGMTRARSMLILTGGKPEPAKDGTQKILIPFLESCMPKTESEESDTPHPRLAELHRFFTASSSDFLRFFAHRFLVQCTPAGLPDRFEETGGQSLLPAPQPLLEPSLEAPAPAVPAGDLEAFAAETSDEGIRCTRRELGNMFHAWFALELSAPASPGEREARMQDFCALWRTDELWPDAGKHLFRFSDALRSRVQALAGEHASLEWRTEEVFFVREEGRDGCFRTSELRLDLLVRILRADGSEHWLIIDHKCGNYGGKDDALLRADLARDYGPQMGGYLRALHAMGRECRCWLHLPLEGKMLEFRLGEEA